MKKKALLLVCIIFGVSGSVFAQDTKAIQEKIDKQYVSKSIQDFMYAVSPQLKAADDFTLQTYSDFYKELAKKPAKITTFNPDTSWGYSENKSEWDSVFVPGSYTHYFVIGDTSDYNVYYNSYNWYADSSKWTPNQLQTTYYTDKSSDSTVSYYFRYGESDPYYGARNLYPEEPSEGADYEYSLDNWGPETGWMPQYRYLYFRNEQGSDTLTRQYSYDGEDMQFYLSYENRSRYSYEDNYSYYRYDYFIKGEPSSSSLTENTSEYMLQENKSWYNGEISAWNRSYTKLGDGGAYLYQTTKTWGTMTMMLQNEDSTHFTYAPDNSKIEQDYYFWDDSLYIWDQYRVSFQQPFNDSYLVDSIMIYDIDTDPESMERTLGNVYQRTEMDYDEDGNQIEVRNFVNYDDSLELASKTIREYKKINGYSTIVATKTYTRDYLTGDLYFYNDYVTNYGPEGEFLGYKQVWFNPSGDTTNAYIIERRTLLDGSTGELRMEWDYNNKNLYLRSVRIYGRQTTGDNGNRFNQSMTLSYNIDGDQIGVNRSMNSYSSYPGIFNDGPVFAALGDTVRLTVSARNPDMSIPDIEVTDMPTSATFDPETNEFYWIVDEASPSPMTYKAIRGDKFVTTEVEFISEQFAVDTEVEDTPVAFDLSQNYPNPFNPATNIQFSIPSSGEVNLTVYNLLGQKVATLISEKLSAGSHTVNFDASQLSSGIYLYRLSSGNQVMTKKMTLIK